MCASWVFSWLIVAAELAKAHGGSEFRSIIYVVLKTDPIRESIHAV